MSEFNHKMPIGIDDFKKLRTSSVVYVDKTLLIRELLEDTTEAFLITRPRRFGKTINMSMIKYFFDIQNAEENRKLFEDTLIAKATDSEGKPCMDQQGKYPVVFLTLKALRMKSYEKMIEQIQLLIADLYKSHAYLLEGNSLSKEEKQKFNDITFEKASLVTLSASLKALTKYLFLYHNKPVLLLLDEYDTPMHTAYSASEPFHEEIIDFMGTFLGEAFKGNSFIKQGIITGILRVSLMNLFSGVNNIIVYSILDKFYADYFGFSESEVEQLFKEVNIKFDLEKIKYWYNGYRIGEKTVYNPWSIISCLRWEGKTKPYWLQSGEHGIIGKAMIASSNMQTFNQLQDLLDDKPIKIELSERTIFADIAKNQRALWSLLLYSGYLTPTKVWYEGSKQFALLKAPNEEVKNTFSGIVENWSKMPGTGDTIYTNLILALQEGNIAGFKNIIQNYILETISFYDLNSDTEERFYHVFLLGIMLTLKDQFIIESNREAGYGRYDIILIPRDEAVPGIVIELKRVEIESAKQARKLKEDIAMREDLLEAAALKGLEQIETRQYAVKFSQHKIKKFFAIAMAFLGKDVAVKGDSKSVEI